jgi:hypothetical protein
MENVYGSQTLDVFDRLFKFFSVAENYLFKVKSKKKKGKAIPITGCGGL